MPISKHEACWGVMFYRPYCQCSKAVSYISFSIFITKLTVLRVEVPQVPQIPYNDRDQNGDGANDDEDGDVPGPRTLAFTKLTKAIGV